MEQGDIDGTGASGRADVGWGVVGTVNCSGRLAGGVDGLDVRPSTGACTGAPKRGNTVRMGEGEFNGANVGKSNESCGRKGGDGVSDHAWRGTCCCPSPFGDFKMEDGEKDTGPFFLMMVGDGNNEECSRIGHTGMPDMVGDRIKGEWSRIGHAGAGIVTAD